MKFFKTGIGAVAVALIAFLVVGCGAGGLTLGTYNATSQTFSAGLTGASLVVNGNDLTLKGQIPYSQGVLGLNAGNIVAIKIMPSQKFETDGSTSVKTTNAESASGWNTYGREAIEDDGSVIWVTSVNKDSELQIKIKWNSNTEEVIYTLTVDENATLLTE